MSCLHSSGSLCSCKCHNKTKSNVNFEMNDKNQHSPPSNLKEFASTPPPYNKVRNPFEKVLIEQLHKPICSPSMCKIYKKERRGSFRWDIDQTSRLQPTDIEACNSQFEPSPDPNLEQIAEEATEIFFSQEMVMPSPMDTSKTGKPLLAVTAETDVLIESFKDKTVVMKDVSAQTTLSLPPELPPELEKMLAPYFTYNQGQDMFGEYEITANGSLRRKLFLEDHSDVEHHSECDSEPTDDEHHTDVQPRASNFQAHDPVTFSPDLGHSDMEHTSECDSEPTDDEYHTDVQPPASNFQAHDPVTFSPDLYNDFVKRGMKRTFGTPLKKAHGKLHNKILDVGDFGDHCLSPIAFTTPPKRLDQHSAASSSLASNSISPITKATSSDEEKNNFTSPESEAMATCLDCIASASDSDPDREKGRCLCKSTLNKISLKRSASLKTSPPRKNSFSFTGKRSLSLSSLHRSRSVLKLDFSMNMSVDGSLHDNSQADCELSPSTDKPNSWSLVGETNHHLVKAESADLNNINVISKYGVDVIDDKTPTKGKTERRERHEISKIRAPLSMTPMDMSLDSSLDTSDNALNMEDKKIDFNNIDLKFLTENITKFDYTATDVTKNATDASSSFKKLDSGINENIFYNNASSYYESAIKPSELTITNSNSTALKEISNVHWARVDSGFKDETSCDNTQFYSDASKSKFRFTEAKLEDKENVMTGDYSGFLTQPPNKGEVMSMSDLFPDDMTFTCNFSSTPSKSKPKLNS